MNQIWNPADRLREALDWLEDVPAVLRQCPDKALACKLAAAQIDESVGEIKEIFADMKKLIQKNNGQAQRINLVIKGKIGNNRGRWYAAPKWKEVAV